MKLVYSAAAVIAAAALFAGCGGGGGGSAVPTTGGGGNNAQQATVMFTVTVPATPPASVTAAGRKPQFQAPLGAQSATFLLNSSGGSSPVPEPPLVANLSASSPGCTSGSSGLTCTISETVPAGADVFQVTTYNQPNAQGTVLGSGSVTVAAVAGQTTNAPTTLSGTVASIALSFSSTIPAGVSGTVPVAIVAKDSSGNIIIGTYTNAITLTDTDASNQTALSAKSVPDSATAAAITLTYKGGVMSAAAQVAASATGSGSIPISAGAAFKPDEHYPASGSITFSSNQTDVGGYYGASPFPQPSDNYIRTITYTSGATFQGVAGLIDEHTTLTSNGVPSPMSPSFDAYLQWSSNPPYGLSLVGSSATTSFYTDNMLCTAPFSPFYVSGATSFQNNTGAGPCTTVSTSSSGSGTSVTNADGSYTGSWLSNSTTWENDIVHADGSAYVAMSNANTSSYVIAIYTPAPNASTIPVYVLAQNSPLPTMNPSPGPANTTIPNWYAQIGLPNGQPPAALVTSSTIVTSSNVTLPASCPVSSAILGDAPSLEKTETESTTFDPLFGAGTDTTDEYLLNGIGLVCLVETAKDVSNDSVSNATYGVTSPPYLDTITLTYYATQSTLSAAASHGGFAHAMEAQGAMFLGAAYADRAERVSEMRHASMLRRVQSIRQRWRSTTR